MADRACAALPLFGLLGLAILLLGRGLSGPFAAASRAGVIVFLVFHSAFDAAAGVATGVMVRTAEGLPAEEQAAAADLIQEYWEHWIVGAQAGLFGIAGLVGWWTAVFGVAVALRMAGSPWPAVLLLGVAGVLFVSHTPPFGPLAMLSFLLAAGLLEFGRQPRRYEPGR